MNNGQVLRIIESLSPLEASDLMVATAEHMLLLRLAGGDEEDYNRARFQYEALRSQSYR